MARLLLLIVLAFALHLTGCGDILSTEPLASKDDTLFDASLLGTWFDQDDTCLTVTSIKPPVYNVLVLGTDKGERFELQARLVRFGNHQILDVTDSSGGLYSIPGHVWVYVEKRGPALQIQYLDTPWLQEMLLHSGLPQFTVAGHPVVTASTARLQEFVRRYGLLPEARGGPMQLVPFKKKSTD